MGTDFMIDKLTNAKIYGVGRNGQEIEISIGFLNNDASLSVSPSLAGSTLTLEAKFTEMTMREIIDNTEIFDAEPSEELNIFLEQFVKE